MSRGNVGYQYANQNRNNVIKVQYRRNLDTVMKNQFISNSNNMNMNNLNMGGSGCCNMDGAGIMNLARKIAGKVKSAGNIAQDIYTSEIGTAIRNVLPDSDDTARDGFAGERHAILKLSNGKNGVANYMGPDTALMQRLSRGDPGRTEVDKISKAHDIRYGLAQNLDDIRTADNKMIKAVRVVKRNRGDAPRNIMLANAITAKKFAEDIGVLKKDAFSGDLSKNIITDADRNILMSNLQGLEQKGYGMLPGDALKQKIIKQLLLKKGKKGKKTTRSSKPTITNKMQMYGRGAIGKPAIEKFVSTNLVPLLMKSVNIPIGTIPTRNISNIISKSLDMVKDGNLSSVIATLSKTILPMLTTAKLQSMHMKGAGIADVLGNAKEGLQNALGKLLFGAFKGFINHGAKIRGMPPPFKGSGIGLAGKGWWSDFARGFTMVFKPFATIAGPILDAMGMPEFGVPLSAVGAAL